jgi:HEAT repeat protein
MIGSPQAVEPLIGALADKSHRVQLATLQALGRIGDWRAIEALVTALGDGDMCTRLTAAAALSEMAGSAPI